MNIDDPRATFHGLEFDAQTHVYRFRGTILTSVTTYLKDFFEPFDQFGIAQKCSENERNPKYYGKSVAEIIAMWNARADHGTRVHEMIEDYINYGEQRFSGDRETDNKAFHGRTWIWDNVIQSKPRYVIPELRVFDLELGIAGTIDLFVMWENGAISLGDWKTNDEISKTGFDGEKARGPISCHDDCNYVKYGLQLSVYAYILQRRGYHVVSRSILHLTEDDIRVMKTPFYAETPSLFQGEVR